MMMADVIRDFRYSKVAGRGRGVLGLNRFEPCRKPGQCTDGSQTQTRTQKSSKVIVALYDYAANPESPGGFTEISIKKGQLLELLKEHPDNEHWWQVANEDGETGFVPSSYLLVKEEQALPWLQLSALQSEEQERKDRVRRLVQQKQVTEGVGFGPAPKNSTLPPKRYVSSYGNGQKMTSSNYHCEVCNKTLNGPKPYQAHMASKAHKEELALLEST